MLSSSSLGYAVGSVVGKLDRFQAIDRVGGGVWVGISLGFYSNSLALFVFAHFQALSLNPTILLTFLKGI